METPQSAYESRRRELSRLRSYAGNLDRRLWLGRRIAFVAVPVLAILAYEDLVAWWSIALPVVVFTILMVLHQTVDRMRERLDRSITFCDRGLARLDNRWAGTGLTGDEFPDPHHPYARDLDIFGHGSLFELICQARTKAGERRLADWLLHPATVEEITERQQAVAELRDRLDLRQDLAIIGDDVRATVHASEISGWGSSPPEFTSRLLPAVALLTGLLTLTAVVVWFGFGLRLPAVAALLAESVFLFLYRHRIARSLSSAERACRDLRLLSALLARLENEPFSSPLLVRLRRQLDVDGTPPSQQIASLSRLLDILDSTKNQIFAPFAFVLLVPAQIAFAIERWKLRSGRLIGPWLDAAAEIEALSSLAGFAFENPENTFPTVLPDQTDHPCYHAVALGHPLLPDQRCVRNDISLDQHHRALIVSGSNMSGKSTMLRTVGINAVLAFAGAPVRARSLQLNRLDIGASIRISDSLQDGASRFYAEITRLKQIVELTTRPLPVLFLLDEILSGTNSHDRRIGAQAIISGLVRRGAIGLTTTHDLALTDIVSHLGNHAANVHFQDHLEDGKMVFDYHMHPGIVTHSNAIELMRSVGLEV